jgi:hypothetical protein
MNRTAAVVCFAVAVFVSGAQAQSNQSHQAKGNEAPQSASSKIPVMDAGAGPCSLELTVLGTDSKPVYDATVKVHIAYGFGGFHRLDLQAGTNSAGKVKFTGIPVKVHNPPLEFDATKDQLEGSVNYDPSAECQAKHDLNLGKPKPAEQQ